MKKGQAAMEFLLTYGWAILAALVVVGALVYFGVLSPQRLAPERCSIDGKVRCADKLISLANKEVSFRLLNAAGADVQIISLNVTEEDGLFKCYAAPPACTPNVRYKSGDSANCVATCQPEGDDRHWDATITQDTKLKAKIILVYEDKGTKFTHTQQGELFGSIE
jgi:hypothetical protein